MKLSELIEHLLEVARELNPGEFDTDILSGNIDIDPEVRLATQPRYPLAHDIDCVTHLLLEEDDHEADEEPGIVWIAEGSSCHDGPYAPRAAWGE